MRPARKWRQRCCDSKKFYQRPLKRKLDLLSETLRRAGTSIVPTAINEFEVKSAYQTDGNPHDLLQEHDPHCSSLKASSAQLPVFNKKSMRNTTKMNMGRTTNESSFWRLGFVQALDSRTCGSFAVSLTNRWRGLAVGSRLSKAGRDFLAWEDEILRHSRRVVPSRARQFELFKPRPQTADRLGWAVAGAASTTAFLVLLGLNMQKSVPVDSGTTAGPAVVTSPTAPVVPTTAAIPGTVAEAPLGLRQAAPAADPRIEAKKRNESTGEEVVVRYFRPSAPPVRNSSGVKRFSDWE